MLRDDGRVGRAECRHHIPAATTPDSVSQAVGLSSLSAPAVPRPPVSPHPAAVLGPCGPRVHQGRCFSPSRRLWPTVRPAPAMASKPHGRGCRSLRRGRHNESRTPQSRCRTGRAGRAHAPPSLRFHPTLHTRPRWRTHSGAASFTTTVTAPRRRRGSGPPCGGRRRATQRPRCAGLFRRPWPYTPLAQERGRGRRRRPLAQERGRRQCPQGHWLFTDCEMKRSHRAPPPLFTLHSAPILRYLQKYWL